jgi:hypothetical protein
MLPACIRPANYTGSVNLAKCGGAFGDRDLLPDDMKLKVFANESSWVNWAMATVGLPQSSVSRFYTLIKDEKVSKVIHKCVKHAFGRETFVVSQWTSIVSQRMWTVCF